MTANVKILIEKVENGLKFPNSALRFKPNLSDAEQQAAYKRAGEEKYYNFTKTMASGASAAQLGAAPGGGGGMAAGMGLRSAGQGGMGGGGNAPRRDPSAAISRSSRGRRVPLWVLGEDKLLRPAIVKLGLSDGVWTEIANGKLKEGDKIIVGLEVDPNRPATTTTRAPGFGPPMGGMGGIRR
jgi:hypothetical protein